MSELIIGCEIDSCGQFVWTSARELHITKSGSYKIKVVSDPEALFEYEDIQPKDFEGLNKAEVIEKFKKSCLNIYTCEGAFSVEDLKKEGNDIRFY